MLKLKSGQINYENTEQKGAYSCIVIRDGVFHNLSESQRLDLISILQDCSPTAKKDELDNDLDVDFDDMFQ